MKKVLLLTTAALLAMSASAQLAVQDEPIESTELGTAVMAAPFITADTKPAPAYFMPTGTYFSSYAKNCYRLNNPILHVPAFADLTFVNASTDATSIEWSYVNPEGEYNFLNPQLTSNENELTVNYRYLVPTTIEAPVLTATNELGDSTTSIDSNTPVYMRVNGPSLQGSTSADETYYGWCNASPLGGKLYYSSGRFATNHANSNTAWAGSTGMEDVSLRGFAELYFKPARPYSLTGFACHVREIAAITSPVTLTIYKVTTSETGALTGIDEVLCTQTLIPDDYEMAGTSRLYMAFNQLVDAKTNEVVESYTIDFPILVAIQLPESDVTSQMGAYYNAVTVNMPAHNYVILNGTKDGEEQKGIFYRAGLNYTGGTYARSFACFSLMGSFEYMIDENEANEMDFEVSGEGDAMTINLKASKPFVDELGLEVNWKATQVDDTPLPEWIDVTVEDEFVTVDGEKVYTNKSAATILVSPNTSADERSCDVKLSFPGAEYIIHVTQAGTTTAIEVVEAAQDNADGPVFNMMGQRVGADAKGLLIRGGKKVLVK